jgi:hypothetical protein
MAEREQESTLTEYLVSPCARLPSRLEVPAFCGCLAKRAFVWGAGLEVEGLHRLTGRPAGGTFPDRSVTAGSGSFAFCIGGSGYWASPSERGRSRGGGMSPPSIAGDPAPTWKAYSRSMATVRSGGPGPARPTRPVGRGKPCGSPRPTCDQCGHRRRRHAVPVVVQAPKSVFSKSCITVPVGGV